MAENLEGKIFNNWKVIGDTGERDSNRGQVVLARHIRTKEVRKISARYLKHADEKSTIDGRYGKNNRNKTGYAGISFDSSKIKWIAQFSLDNEKNVIFKRFDNFEDAVLYKNKKEMEFNRNLNIKKINKKEIELNNYVICKQKEIDNKRKNKKLKSLMKVKTNNNAYFHKGHKKWTAYINENGKQKHLGYFETEEEAIKAKQNYIKTVVEPQIKQLKEIIKNDRI